MAVVTSRAGVTVTVKNENGMVIHQAPTPFTITLKSSDGFFDRATYNFESKSGTMSLTASLNPWYVGNIIFGGLIGFLIVDPLTGAMWKLPENAYVQSIDAAFQDALQSQIAKGLYPVLDEGWHASNGRPCSKRYSDLVRLLSLTRESSLARIKLQFEAPLHELNEARFLEGWDYRRSSDDQDCILRFRPGPKFFEDQARQPSQPQR